MMEPSRCETVIIGASDYRENDRLLNLFSLEHGRISGVARGAKRSVRRFGGALELFARLFLQIKVRPGLSQVIEAEIVTIHPGIRSELARIAHAGYATELLAHFSPEGVPNQRLFRLITSYLGHLDSNPASPSDRRFYEINLLNILGYRPSLDCCSRCGRGLLDGRGDARAAAGGEVLCSVCGPYGRPLDPVTLDLLGRSLKSGRFGEIRFPPALLAEAGDLLDNAIASHLAAPLRSLPFLKELEAAPAP